mgnify:CR=1 FL=1
MVSLYERQNDREHQLFEMTRLFVKITPIY